MNPLGTVYVAAFLKAAEERERLAPAAKAGLMGGSLGALIGSVYPGIPVLGELGFLYALSKTPLPFKLKRLIFRRAARVPIKALIRAVHEPAWLTRIRAGKRMGFYMGVPAALTGLAIGARKEEK